MFPSNNPSQEDIPEDDNEFSDESVFGFEKIEREEESFDEVGVHPDDPRVMLDDLLIIDDKDEYDAIALFHYGVKQGCSDIHLTPGSPPKLRIKGELKSVEGLRTLNSADTDWIRQQTMQASDQGEFINRVYDHVYAWDIPSIGRFRMIVAKVSGGLSIVARLLVDDPPTFDELNTPYAIRDLAKFNSGLILVSGITGSGKSTLMAAMIQYINANNYVNIISLEDPIEIIHRPILANVTQRGIGAEVETFSSGIRDSMRQDPDVILIGEIRDTETAQAALHAAQTGHLVISTVHAMSSTASIGRMLDLFEGQELKSAQNRFAEVLRGIVSQKLVKTVDGNRTAVNEILLNTAELKAALEADADPSTFRQILEDGREIGMQTFEDHLLRLLSEEAITEKIALAQANDREQMIKMIEDWKNTGHLVVSASTTTPATVIAPDTGAVPVVNPFTKPAPGFPTSAPATEFPTTPHVARSFSEEVKKEEDATGIVTHRSGSAPSRPQVFRPRR